MTASSTAYKSEIIRLDANDLDNEVLTLLTFSEDLLAAMSLYLPIANVVNNLTTTASGYAMDARQGKALNDAIKVTSITSPEAGTSVTLNRFMGRTFLGMHWIELTITTSASLTSSAVLLTGLPNATDLIVFSMSNGVRANVRTNGTIHFAATTAAGTYDTNFVYV